MPGHKSRHEADLEQPPQLINLLASPLRWGMLRALTASDLQVNELVEQLRQPMNLVSYHLKKMREAGLVETRRSEADARDIYYSLDLNRLYRLYVETGTALHPALSGPALPDHIAALEHKRILFVCTHNSARSQMAEGLLRHLSQGRLDTFSAGSHPTEIHPDAIRTMDALGIDIRGQRAKPLADFEGQRFDTIITVCDRAREVCPTFPGAGRPVHWGFPDPIGIADARQRAEVFERTAYQLQSRITYFLSTLPAQPDESAHS